MSRPANHPTDVLLATARWLKCVEKLSVRALRRCHKRTATDRVAAVCRLVHAKARQRTHDARTHGVIAESASGSEARRPARTRRSPKAPTQRAQSTLHTARLQQPARATRNVGAPHRAVSSQSGPRDAVIAALNAQAKRAHEDRLQQIAEEQRQLRERLDGIERKVAVHTATPVTPAAPKPAPTAHRAGMLTVLVRRCVACARVLLQRLSRARP